MSALPLSFGPILIVLQFETKVDKYLKALSSFRDDVRKLAIDGASAKEMLLLCDRFRDQDLVNLGVQLDDGQGAGLPFRYPHHNSLIEIDGRALYKLVDPSALIRQRDERVAIAADKASKKEATAAAAESKRIATLEKGRIPPGEMFRPPNVDTGLYSQWDEQGIPVKDGEGNEVTKNAGKKFLKEWKSQEKAHEAFVVWQKEGGN